MRTRWSGESDHSIYIFEGGICESLAESDLVSGSEEKRGIDNLLPERSVFSISNT